MTPPGPGSSRKQRRAGFALVLALAMIVLVTVAVMAFFTHAASNRQIEGSLAAQVEADEIARSAIDHAISLSLGEITSATYSTSTNVGGAAVYSPSSNANIAPRRTLAADIPLTDSNFFNLIRQSISSADSRASADSTAAPSRNGRQINAGEWNTPRLLGGSGFSSASQLPHWIYVTRSHGLTNAPTADVIGRFAYNTYEIGGLIDINSGGYDPDVIQGAAIARLKGSVAGADLTQLNMTPASITKLIDFRSSRHDTETQYLERASASARRGHLARIVTNLTSGHVYTNNPLLHRQDLLRYVRTQNPGLEAALPYLTHFTRSVSAPSWRPPAVTDRNPDFTALLATTSASSVRHYDDDGSSFTYTIKPGEPYLRQKFSLARLAWLTPTGPASPGLAPAIKACFGLVWSDSAEHWDYVGATGSSPVSTIKSVAEILAESIPREMDFFEILKAGIAEGSLGMATDTIPSIRRPNYPSKTTAADSHFRNSSFGNNIIDGNKDLHLLRIGANIIDCADSDNYPTILALQYGSIPVEVAGIEDLPYLYCLNLVRLNTLSADGTLVTNCDLLWVPEFFNPHRTSPSTATSSPSSLSFGIASGNTYRVFWVAGDKTLPSPIPLTDGNYPRIVLDSATISGSRNGPVPVRDGTQPNRLGKLVPYLDPAYSNVLGYLIYSYQNSFPSTFGLGTWPAILNPKSTACPGLDHSQLVVRMQYTSPRGQWKTYSNPLGGNDAFPEAGLDGLYPDDRGEATFKYGPSWESMPQNNSLARMMYLATGDGRTGRFGASTGRYNRALSTPPSFTGTMGHAEMFTFHPYDPASGYLGLWGQQCDTTTSTLSTVPDVDGAKRPADGYLGSSATTGPANPYRNLGDMGRRPVILQRPYRSVAELGYVFRDAPCKSLNFFSAQSGDSALLDLFSIGDEPPVTTGKVNLNTPHAAIRKALLSHAGDQPDGITSSTFDTAVPAIGSELGKFAKNPDGSAAQTILQNVGQLPVFMASANLSSALSTNTYPVKYKREAIVRSLAGATQSRTWNFLVDVIAQKGSFPSAANLSTGDFAVQAEQRCWFSVAIDRFSARVIDSQLENVRE